MQRTAEIRKMISSVEDIHREAGTALATPSRKCVIAAVIANPLAGMVDGDLDILKDIGAAACSISPSTPTMAPLP